jgi:hypothetical protein
MQTADATNAAAACRQQSSAQRLALIINIVARVRRVVWCTF